MSSSPPPPLQAGQGVMEVMVVVVGGVTSTAMEEHTHIMEATSNTITHSNHCMYMWTTLLLFIYYWNNIILLEISVKFLFIIA